MVGRRGVERLARLVLRSRAHGRRAVHAVRRSAPGRYPGTVEGVDQIDGSLFVRGFVRLDDHIDAVIVTFDGVPGALASVDARHEGGVATLTTVPWRSMIPPGTTATWVTIGAIAVGRSGLAETLDSRRVRVVDPSDAPPLSAAPPVDPEPIASIVHGLVDLPREGAVERGGVIEVAGWVLPAMAIDRVEVTVDDRPPEAARIFCAPRPDLVDHFDDPTAVLGGFWHAVDTSTWDRSTATVLVDAVTVGGRVRLGERTVVVESDPPGPDPDDRRWVRALSARAALATNAVVPGESIDLVVFTHHLGLGGAQLWLQEILRSLLRRDDVSCTVIAPADGPLRRELEAAGARVHIAGPFPTAAGAYESSVRELIGIVAEEGSNVALVNTAGAFIGVDVAARSGLPSIWAIHEHYPPAVFWHCAFGRDRIEPHVRAQGMAARSRSTVRCFVAEATRASWVPANALDPGRDLVVDYGIPLAHIEADRVAFPRDVTRAAYGFRAEDQLLICVATLEHRKAQSNIVLAVAHLADEHPDLQLALVGAFDDEYTRSVERLADALGLRRRVRVVPLTDKVAPWYLMADGFVLASDVESLPRSIIEAMAYEVPVVATATGGVAEIVIDGETGILCAPRDIGALVAGLERLLSSTDDERSALTSRAVALVRSRGDVHGYTDTFSALLAGLAKDPDATPSLLVRDVLRR